MKKNSNILNFHASFGILIETGIAIILLLPIILMANERIYPVYKLNNKALEGDGTNEMFAGLSNCIDVEIATYIESGINFVQIKGNDTLESVNSDINPFKHILKANSINYNSDEFSENTQYTVFSGGEMYTNNKGFRTSYNENSQQYSSNKTEKTPIYTRTLGNVGNYEISRVRNPSYESNNSNSIFFQASEQYLTVRDFMQKTSPTNPPDPNVIPVERGTTLLLLLVGIYGYLKQKGTIQHTANKKWWDLN